MKPGLLAAGCLIPLALLACDVREREPELGEQAQAQTLYPAKVPGANIDLEGAGVSVYPPSGPPPLWLIEVGSLGQAWSNSQHRFELGGSAIGPEYAANKPYVSSSLKYAGERSLQLTLPPRPTFAGRDWVWLVANEEGFEAMDGVGFNFDNPKYFGFAIFVHGSSSLPLQSPVQFMQARQFGLAPVSGIGNCNIPLTATLVNAFPGLRFKIEAGDNAGLHQLVPETVISVGTWHTFVFYLQPNSNQRDGTGVATVWFDGGQIADYHGDWGCNTTGPEANNGAYGTIQDKWALEVGLHRTTDGAIINQWLYAFFDNVRVAPSRRQADSTEAYSW